MKQLSISRLVVVFLLALCSSATFASDFVTVDGFKFLVDTDKDEARLLANDYSGEVVVPASVTFEGKDYPVTVIGSNCFSSSTKSVLLPNTVTEFEKSAFSGTGIKNLIIPNSVVKIGEGCFSASSLETIVFPSGITEIPANCFFNCWYLKSVKLPSSVKNFGVNCFASCPLKELILPEGLEELDGYVLCYCKTEKVVLPSTLTKLNQSCFYETTTISELICKAITPPYTYKDSFDDIDFYNCTLYVPLNSIALYKEDSSWGQFKFIKAIEEEDENEPTTACSTPVISYENGKLNFESSTSGAEYHYTIKDGDVVTDKYNTDGNVQLAGKLDISVYATADGYMASEKAAATLYWLNAAEGETDNINLVKTRGVMVSTDNGITISGLKDGEVVTFYSVSGVNLGSAKAVQGIAHIERPQENIVIAKINGQEIKIAVK